MADAKRDANNVPVTQGVSDLDGMTPLPFQIDHLTGGLKLSAIVTSGNGITSLNGLTGSSQTFTNDTNVTVTSAGTAHVIGWSGILASSRGGTGNGFTKFSGATTAEKTYTLPDVSTTILTTNSAVTLAQGGTGANLSSIAKGGLISGTGAGTVGITTVGTDGQVLIADAASAGGVKWSTVTGTGTVTTVSVATANGVSGTVANATTTPAITLTLGAITPTSVNGNTITTGTGTLTLSTYTLTVAGTASVSGTNTGDQTNISGNAGTVTNATLTTALTVNTGALTLKGNADGTSQLTVGSGSVSVSGTNTGDQTSVSGNAGTATALATPRAIYGNNFDGSAALTQIIASTYGGTGNGFTKFSGAATSEKTYTLPNASCNVLTDNSLVTVAQGGSGVGSHTAYAVLCGGTTSTGAVQSVASVGTSGQVLTSNGAGALPTFQAVAATSNIYNFIDTATAVSSDLTVTCGFKPRYVVIMSTAADVQGQAGIETNGTITYQQCIYSGTNGSTVFRVGTYNVTLTSVTSTGFTLTAGTPANSTHYNVSLTVFG